MSNEFSKTIEVLRRRAEKEWKRMQQQDEKRKRQEEMRQRKLERHVRCSDVRSPG